MSPATHSARASDAEVAELLVLGTHQLGVSLAAADVDRLVAYVRLIERWNATYNLTSIRDPRAMVTHHLLDCLAAAQALHRRRGEGGGEAVVDVGSGAGLPGLVIAMTSPARTVTCVDSVGKKAAFIAQAAGVLGLRNVTAQHVRIEKVADRFDVVASRAFASLADFVEATNHVLRAGGSWMAMKGKTPHQELGVLPRDLTFHVEPLEVPLVDAERCIVWLERQPEASARS